MADRDNPKLSVRPLSKPKPAAPAATGEDQLAKPARMVSGRPIVDPARAILGKTVPVTRAVSSDVALVNELEAKLLDDLEALSSTFYAQPSPPPAPAAAPHPKPQPAAPPAPAPVAPPAPAPAPASAVLAPRAERHAPAASPTDRSPVGGTAGVAAEKASGR
jgi:hypothetical protein